MGQLRIVRNRSGTCRDKWGELKKICHLDDLSIDGRIILKGVFSREDVAVVCTDSD